MRKFFAIALSALSISFAAISAEAKPANAAAKAAPQSNGQYGQRQGQRRRNNRSNHRVWTTTQTRVVNTRRGLFRETYLITHLPNGRTQSRLISRVRVTR
jgi:hypothetical protein